MRLVPASLTLALAILPHLPAFALPACAQTPLVINEILAGPARDWDGSGVFSTRDDEWVEILNTSAESLDLDGWLLTDGDALPRCALTGLLPPGARRVVTGREAYDWERAHGYPAFGLSLGNTGDRVMLWKVAAPDTVLMDSYVYLSHEAAADRAIARLPDGGPVWTLFDGLNPYVGTLLPQGNGCAPTPGAVNACVNTPTRAISWGQVKTLYR